MKNSIMFASALFAAAVASGNVMPPPEKPAGFKFEKLDVKADYMAADKKSESFVATGNVVAVSGAVTLRVSEGEVKKEGGTYSFPQSAMLTTCTNDACRIHWSVNGKVIYKERKSLSVHNAFLRLYGIPVFWLPCWYYPVDTDYGWRVMPGYTSRWGAYILTKYVYGIAGSFGHGEYGLAGSTRLDLRTENGIAAGQSLKWQLGNAGRGRFKVYYAWDADSDRYDRNWDNLSKYNYKNWGSTVPEERYAVTFGHEWNPTERDSVKVSGVYYSDSHFVHDFLRDGLFGNTGRFTEYGTNVAFWEHMESSYAFGVAAGGVLNDFIPGVSRLPEANLEFMPQSVFSTPVNYESKTSVGWYNRDYAKYGNSSTADPFRYNPGRWADYQAFRMDTYHRLTLPFRTAGDIVSVVPRFGVRGTYWSDQGVENLDGRSRAGSLDEDVFRSVVEGGVSFSAKAKGHISGNIRHVFEPYADFLVQEARYSSLRRNGRPYLFDSVDFSRDWLSQHPGSGAQLPYSWYGVTPGVRNTFRFLDDESKAVSTFDVDVYASLRFNGTSWTAGGKYHRLAENPEDPVNGDGGDAAVFPGVRLAYVADDKSMFFGRIEMDTDEGAVSYADAAWIQTLTEDIKGKVQYSARNQRFWDFASTVFDPAEMSGEDFNWAKYSYLELGFEHDVCERFAWCPFTIWDFRENELSEIGAWFDLRTDCLGFRFMVSYENEFTRIDRSREDDDWRFGFFIYLRALGPMSSNPLK